MATSGFSPLEPYAPMGAGVTPPTDEFSRGIAAIDQASQTALAQTQPQVQEPAPSRNPLLFNQATRQFFANGVTFSEDDDAMILQAEQLLDKPSVGRPEGVGWTEVTPETYAQLADQIRNPTMGRLFSKNFGIGVDQLQMLAGYGLQLAGAEELGGQIVEQQVGSETVRGDLQKTTPYIREFTDIESGGEAVDWFVATLGQQGPNILESIGVAALGAAAGTAAAGPLGGAAGALATFVSKKALKDQIKAAAKRYTKAKAEGIAPSAADVKILKNAAAVSGAVAASVASNYATGAADIYGEIREQGADADDVVARMTALAGAVPYAALESTGEFLLASRIFGNVLQPRPLTAGATRTQQGLQLLRRGAAGAGVGATAEGLTELGQEGLVMGLSGQDLTSDEAVQRFINSFAAGAAVGGAIGGVANLKRGKPAGETGPTQSREISLLDSSGSSTEQKRLTGPAATGTDVVPFTTPVTPMGRITETPLLPAPGQVLEVRGRPDFVVDSTGTVRQAMPEDVVVGVTDNIPGAEPGMQGVLNIFGDEGVTAGELAARMQPVGAPPQLEAPPQAPTPVAPGQLALQFAPPAPEGTGFAAAEPTGTMANRLQQIQEQRRRQQEFDLAEQQRQQQEAAVREQQMNLMERERQLQLAQEQPPTPAEPPMRPVPVRQPQQLPLFPPSELPRPSRGEALRRGVVGAGLPPLERERTTPLTPQEARRAGQLPLFTQEGQPSVAALKAAGQRGRVPTPTLEKGATQAPPTGRKVTPESKRKAQEEQRKKEEARNELIRKGQLAQAGRAWPRFADSKTQPKWKDLTDDQKEQWRLAFVEGRMSIAESERIAPPKKEKPSAVQKPSAKKVPTRSGAKAGAKVGEKVPSKKQTTKKGEGLKKGKPKPKQEVEETPAQTWAAMNTGVAWKDLSDSLKKRWTDSDRSQPVADDITVEHISDPENLWNDMKPDYAPAFADLPSRTRLAWRNAVAGNTATDDLLRSLTAEFVSPDQLLAEDISLVEGATDVDSIEDSLRRIVEVAFFDENASDSMKNTATEFLANSELTAAQRSFANQEMLGFIATKLNIYATSKGKPRAWFNYAVAQGLVEKAKLLTTIKNLPAEYKELAPSNATDDKVDPRGGDVDEKLKASNQIIDKILSLRKGLTTITNNKQLAALKKEMKELFAKADPEFPLGDGSQIDDYFKANGEPKTMKSVDGGYKIVKQELDIEQQRALEREIREAREAENMQAAEEERERIMREGFDNNAWDDDADGMYFRGDGERIENPIEIGRLKMLAKSFLSKLSMKPKVHVFANQADLQAKDPALYKRAAAARKNGDFDTTLAAGYSFGDTVILFSDNIRTEQQARFIIAHETLGHFGFKGIMSQAQFRKALENIYNTDANVRAAVEQMMEVRGMDKLEAIEEYLADNAAILDSSLIQRAWYAIKNFLNRLGFDFQDDEARYLVGLARKYVRNGSPGNFVSGQSLGAAINQSWKDNYDGRFSEAPDVGSGPKFWASASDASGYSYEHPLNKVQETFSMLRARGIDVSRWTARVLETLQSFNNIARRSPGASMVYDIIASQANMQRSLARKFDDMTRMLHSTAFDSKEREQVSEMLAYGALYKARQLKESPDLLKSFERLVIRNPDGTIDEEHLARVRQQLEQAGAVTLKEFNEGFQVMLSDGEVKKFQMKVTEDSDVWKAYTQLREGMNESFIDMMLANYGASYYEGEQVLNTLRKSKRLVDVLRDEDLQRIRNISRLYQNIRYSGSTVDEASLRLSKEGQERSEEFIRRFAEAVKNDNAFNDFVNKAGVAEQFANEEFYDDAVQVLQRMRAEGANQAQDGYAVRKAIEDLFLYDFQTRNADYYAKRSILSSYSPFRRRGDIQVRLVAMAGGKPIQLREDIRGAMPYYQFESVADSRQTVEMLEDLYGKGQKWTMEDSDGNEVTVTFKVERQTTRTTPDLVEAINFNEFVYAINRLNVNLTPDVREKIIQTMTSQDEAARKNLERTGTPGWDRDMIRSVSEHMEIVSYSAAKKIYRHRLDDIILNTGLWRGDRQKLNELKAAVDQATNDEMRAAAQREYDEYAYKYINSAPEGETVDGRATKGRGEDYREHAKGLIRWRNENPNVVVNSEDILSTDLGSRLKIIAVTMQLGGSIATGIINLTSLITNTIPWLATYNSKTAYGGGFGFAKTMKQITTALSDMGSNKLTDAVYLEQLVQDLKAGKSRHGLTVDEAQFLLDSTRGGLLDAAQTIALLGTARGKLTNPFVQKGIDLWMTPFNYTEQVNRRATALASYRMERDRRIANGMSEAEAAKFAKKFATDAVNTTQGEYAAFNRSKIGRGNIMQYVMMYKMYPIVVVQLLKNMDYKGKAFMLGMLLLMSGLKGLPFAEDLFDVYDTIAQKLGLTRASAEKMFIDGLNSIAPGITPIAMRGILDQSGLAISSRVGQGNMLPMTGVFKAGANTWREFEEFIGPMYSALTGLFGMAGSVLQYGAEAVGLRNGETSLTGIMRDSPLSALRAFGDGLTYLDDGRVTNSRGYVVADNVPTHILLARFLGFYPSAASMQNDIIRLQKETAEYAKAIKAEYVGSYVKAKLSNDREAMDRIRGYVDEWNDYAKGSGLEITKFLQSANRAAREAERPALERYLKSAPRGVRKETEQLGALFGVN